MGMLVLLYFCSIFHLTPIVYWHAGPPLLLFYFSSDPDCLIFHLTPIVYKWRDKSGAYDHLAPKERPMFHDIRALGIMLYHKAGYPKEYIMALAGHAKEALQTTT